MNGQGITGCRPSDVEQNCYMVMLMTGYKDAAVSRLYEKAGFVRCTKEGLIAYPPES